MDMGILLVIILYALSSVGYLAYFFKQKKSCHQTGFTLMCAAFICHSLLNVALYINSGDLAIQDLSNTFSIASWAIAGIFILLRLKFGLKILGAFAAPLAAFIMVVVLILPDAAPHPKAVFSSYWVLIHVITIFTGEAAFALACAAGIMYLLQEHAIKSKKGGFFFKRLPSLDLIDTTAYSCTVAGFIFLTVGLILGVVYGKMVSGQFWGWTPKEIWSAVTWIIYAVLLHGRLALGWYGRRSAIVLIFGFVLLLFTFFGVNALSTGHHGDVVKPVVRQDISRLNIDNDLTHSKRSMTC